MHTREVLLNTIILMYRESQQDTKSKHIADWVLESISDTPPSAGAEFSVDTTKELTSILRGLSETETPEPIDLLDLSTKIKLASGGDEGIISAFTDNTTDLHSNDEISNECFRLRKSLMAHRRQVETVAVMQNASKEVLFGSNPDARKIAAQLISDLEPLVTQTESATEGDLGILDLDDTGDVIDMLQLSQESSSGEGVLRPGWQGLCRMLGVTGGFRRGDMVCFGALQHQYKSGTLLNMAKHIALYNKPYMLNKDKVPVVLHITLENNQQDNVFAFYQSIAENETSEVVSVAEMDIKEAGSVISDRLSANGYKFLMLRAGAGTYSVNSLKETIAKLENKGYEVHAVVCDYLALFSKEGCVGGNDATMMRDLFRKVRGFLNPKMITFITAHQLSSEAKYVLRNGTECFVKQVGGGSYWDGCKSLDQELDIEIMQHTVVNDLGDKYLEMFIGKHRVNAITPESHKYFAQKFHMAGAIRDDVNSEAEWVPKIPTGLGGVMADFE